MNSHKPHSMHHPGLPGRRQRGAIAIVVALSIAVLVGFVGLALDLGKLYVAKTELQNSADACALSAARELTGVSNTQLTIAEAAGIKAASLNRVIFQGEHVTDVAVTFSETLNGFYAPKFEGAAAIAMGYARCTTARTGIDNWFMQVLNLMPGVNVGSQAVAATAVASLLSSQTNCAVPVGICSSDVAGQPVGAWLEGTLGPPGNELTGNFKWIDFTPPAGGASELAAILTGTGACDIPAVGAQVGQPGNVSSLGNDWNTRFGIYSNGLSLGSAVPDFTGYAYTDAAGSWPSKFNAFDDYMQKRTSNAGYQGNASTGLGIKHNAAIADAAHLAAYGADRRLVITPIVDCSEFVSGSTAAVQDWACVLMLHPINTNSGGSGTGATRMYLEYRGRASDPANPCATLGTPGGANSIGPKVPGLVQ